MIKCYHCSGKHEFVAQVKACANVKAMPNLDEILGTDGNPDPKAELDKWQAAEQAKLAEYAAKVEVGTIVETVIPAAVKVEPFVPAHRKTKLAKQHAAAIAAANSIAAAGTTMVKIPGLDISVPAPASEAAVIMQTAKKSIDQQIAEHDAALAVIKKGQDLELGMYQVKNEDGTVTVYKVTTGKHSSYKQAQKLHISNKSFYNQDTQAWDVKPVGKFFYAPGMMNKLTSENKMTEADAKAFHDATKAKYGVDYGFCCVCGKLLIVKKSIDAGIGPVCSSKL